MQMMKKQIFIGITMKIKLDKTDSTVMKSNETYDVIDNTNLNNLVVSKTILHAGKETSGHFHRGQEEVYIFTKGRGKMQVGDDIFKVTGENINIKSSVVIIPLLGLCYHFMKIKMTEIRDKVGH